ncbi:MAG: hypothetical protein AAF357_15280 [Verrucomicrobiota bacterium]
MLLLLVISVVAQQFAAPLVLGTSAGVLEIYFLVPWVTFYALSLAVPYPLMLLFAFTVGFLWDATLPVVLTPEEFRFGISIAFFALFGSLVQGIRPLFRRGNWILPIIMVGAAVLLHLFAEFILLSFARGSFPFSAEIWFRMISTSSVAMLMTPFLLFFISRVARRCGYQLEYEQLMLRESNYGLQI